MKYYLDGDGFYTGIAPTESGQLFTEITPIPFKKWQRIQLVNSAWVRVAKTDDGSINAFKSYRESSVLELTVTVNGNTYNADESSQSRMSRAIQAAEFLSSPVIPFWRMADNTTATNIPLNDFKQALAQSVLAMASLWLPE